MANGRIQRQARKARSGGDVKLNITSMMDMFTIILVFLLKSFSTQGQLVTPATGLVIPNSTTERNAKPALNVKVSDKTIMVEDKLVIDADMYEKVTQQKDYLIPRLHEILSQYADEAKKTAEMFNQEFSGEIAIQGDVAVPYNILTRIMYTCGQAGYPSMNLIVYKVE